MSRWLALLREAEIGPKGTDRTDKSPSVSFVSAIPPPLPGAEVQAARLRRLAAVADCPPVHVDHLHPAELAEYAHYPDADAVASLRHLAACRDCQRRQCRPVTCGTCARYLPNALNPEAGMGQCGDQYARAGVVLSFPHAPRHCQGWRAAA